MIVQRIAAAALAAALAGGAWRLAHQVELLRHELTDRRIDDAAVALQAWGQDERDVAFINDALAKWRANGTTV